MRRGPTHFDRGMDGEEDGETDANIKLLEALMLYSPRKLVGVHKHFCLLGICEHLERRYGIPVTATRPCDLVGLCCSLPFARLTKRLARDGLSS